MSTKVCFKCGVEKDLSEFYAHPEMADGHLNKCKECAKMDVKLRRIFHPLEVHLIDKKRNENPERIEKMRKRTQRYRIEHHDRYIAMNKVNNAIRDGRLIKPTKCEICGCGGIIHAHHHDYSKPLDVLWVCCKCHYAMGVKL